jgi:hypothetical protein
MLLTDIHFSTFRLLALASVNPIHHRQPPSPLSTALTAVNRPTTVIPGWIRNPIF